jgi:hypothetical protein
MTKQKLQRKVAELVKKANVLASAHYFASAIKLAERARRLQSKLERM